MNEKENVEKKDDEPINVEKIKSAEYLAEDLRTGGDRRRPEGTGDDYQF